MDLKSDLRKVSRGLVRLLEMPIRAFADASFSYDILDSRIDIVQAKKILSKEPYLRTEEDEATLEYFEQRYPETGECPHVGYSFASKKLRIEYNVLHRKMINLLHPIIYPTKEFNIEGNSDWPIKD